LQVKILNFHQNYRKLKNHIIISILIAITVFIILLVIPQMTFNLLIKMDLEELTSAIVVLLFWCGSTLYIMTHCILMLSIRNRLKILNEILKCKLNISTLLSLSSLHMDLCELVRTVNKITSFVIISTIGMTIINATFVLFEFYDFLNSDQKHFLRILFCFCSFLLLSHFVMQIIIIIVVCTFTMREGERIVEVLHENIYKEIEILDSKIMKRFQIFLIQLDHFDVSISCGFFKLDWKVLIMVSLHGFIVLIYKFFILLVSWICNIILNYSNTI